MSGPGALASTHAQALALPDEEYRRRAASDMSLLAWCGGEPVGIVGMVPADGGGPAHRQLVSMSVTLGNDAARRLYERCGFVLTGRRQAVRADDPGRLEEEMWRGITIISRPRR